MKITLSRDEIRGLIKDKYGITDDSFILEISSEGAKTSREVVEPEKPQQPEKEPEVEFDITVDANGFITDMVPKKKEESFVPFKDHRGRTFNYQNVCKVCGNTFYTMTKPADICSGDCLKAFQNQQKVDKKAANKVNKPKQIHAKHEYNHVCVICNKEFVSDGPRSKYCSDECKKAGTTEYKPATKHKYRSVSNTKKKKKRSSEIKPSGAYSYRVPNKPKLDYTPYAEKIEEFLNSGQSNITLESDGISLAGMRDRYKTAANLFDLADKIHLSYSSKRNTLRMTRAEVMSSASGT